MAMGGGSERETGENLADRRSDLRRSERFYHYLSCLAHMAFQGHFLASRG